MNKEIICVDDEQEILDLFEEILIEGGFFVKTFSSPTQAVDYCEKLVEQPLAFFVDLSMPECNGVDLRSKIFGLFPDVPFCVVSGDISQSVMDHQEDLKISMIFEKPFKGNDILSFLNKFASTPQSKAKILNLPKENKTKVLQNSVNPVEADQNAKVVSPSAAKNNSPVKVGESGKNFNLTSSPASVGKTVEASAAKSADPHSAVKVDSGLLDKFMESAGELTVVRNIVNKIMKDLDRKYPTCDSVSLLSELLEDMHKLTSETQTKIQELRLVSMQEICKNLPRAVRDLSKKLNKDIAFETIGESVLIDNGHAKVLSECLVHLVRNSADHGVEDKGTRLKNGKDPRGKLTVSAVRNDSSVVIEVIDDGKGIDAKVVGRKALEKGIVDQETLERMTKQEVQELIFKPGFSTAEQITDVSGRGVGMDMVFSSIRDLRGETELISVEGKGSTFRIRLPDPGRANIIEALLLTAGGENFALPQAAVVRAYEISEENIARVLRNAAGVSLFLNKDDELLPIINLTALLRLPTVQSKSICDLRTYVEVKTGASHYCLQVDSIIDTEEIVTRKIGILKDTLSVFTGVTYVGVDGLCLILEIEAIAKFAKIGSAQRKSKTKRNSLSEAEFRNDQSQAATEHLLISSAMAGDVAMQLHQVDRLERVKISRLQIHSDGCVVLYQGKVTPVLPIDHFLFPDKSELESQRALISKIKQIEEKFKNTQASDKNLVASEEEPEIEVIAFRNEENWVLLQVGAIVDAFFPESIQSTANEKIYALNKGVSIPIINIIPQLIKEGYLPKPLDAFAPSIGLVQPLAPAIVEDDGIFWAV